MNNKLIAMAVAAALAAPMAAQADTTVYAKINMGIVSYDDGDTGTNVSDGIGVFDEASRLGAKGSSDLGGGMKAIFKMEGTTNMDTGAFTMNRDTYVGLAGGFGEVTIGRRNTSYKDATGEFDLFADMWGDVTGSGFGAFDQREANMIRYKNKFGVVGFSADLQMAEQNDAAGGTVDEGAMGNSIAVSFAPIKGLNISLASATCGGVCAAGAEGDSSVKLGVQWKGGAHTVNFIALQDKDDSTPTNDNDVMIIQYGLAMGNNMFQLSYSTAETDAAAGNTGVTQTSAAFVHKMSKSTKVYVAYSAIDNEAGVSHDGRLDSGLEHLDNTTAGSDPSTVAVGITTSF